MRLCKVTATETCVIQRETTKEKHLDLGQSGDKAASSKQCVLWFSGASSIDHNDLKDILSLLRTGQMEQLRKYNTLLLDYGILGPSTNVRKLNFAGNDKIGNLGMNHLRLIPDTVTSLDFSWCGLGSQGIITLCRFLEGNKCIKQLTIRGTRMDRKAVRAIARMISKNDTLEELAVSPYYCKSENPVDASNPLPSALKDASTELWHALVQNKSLKLLIFHPNFSDGHHFRWSAFVATSLPKDTKLQTLDIGDVEEHDTDPGRVIVHANEQSAVDAWLKLIQTNECLTFISCSATRHPQIQYYLDLNQVDARRIVRDPASSVEEWLQALEQAGEIDRLDAIHFLVRNKVQNFAH